MMSEGILEGKSPQGVVRYEKVSFGLEGPGANVFAPRSTKFGPRFQMAISLLAGILLMVSHHLFCSYLDGKAVESQRFANHGFDQSISSIISNAIAFAAKTVLSAGIGIAFIQVLWSKLRSEHFSVKQIDAMLACRGEPFAPTALPTWYYAFWLAAMAAAATLMAFISIIAPGSLRVDSTEFPFSDPCTVRTVSLETSDLATFMVNSTDGSTQVLGAHAGLMGLTSQVVASGSTLQARNPCAGACQYEISFNAPLAECNSMNTIVDGVDWLPIPDNSTAPVRLWVFTSQTSAGVFIGAAARGLSTDTQSVVNCSIYNATQHAIVTHSNTSTSLIHVYQTDRHEMLDFWNPSWVTGLDYTGMQYYSVIVAFLGTLGGNVTYNPEMGEFGANDIFTVGYSPSFAGSMGDPWATTPDLMTVLPSLMQNISLSLLNDQLSKGNTSTTTSMDTTCSYVSPTYRYIKARLLLTYGVALLIASVCVLFGYRAVHKNRCEESIVFSRILGAILSKNLCDAGERNALSSSSELTMNGSGDGQLRLVSTMEG